MDTASNHPSPPARHEFEEKRKLRLKQLAADLRGGRLVTDFRFDQVVYPLSIRKLSEIHWTPIEVATRAAELLIGPEIDGKPTRILDVGSGCGKFCTVGALTSRGHFTGIEQRLHFVEAARKYARELGATRASFIHGNMVDLDWNEFDAFYLFNPFYEHQVKSIRIDETISYSQTKFSHYAEIVRTKLKAAPPGTKVATYHGFGGDFPMGYHLVKKEPAGTSYLEIWMKLELPTFS